MTIMILPTELLRNSWEIGKIHFRWWFAPQPVAGLRWIFNWHRHLETGISWTEQESSPRWFMGYVYRKALVVSWLFAWYLLHFVLETWKGSGFPIQNPACADRDEGMALFTSSRPAIPYWHLAVMPGMWDPTLHIITNKWRFKESMIAPSSNHRQDWQNRNKSSGNPYGKIWQNGCECSMDWFKGKSSPETIDFPIFYGAIL